MNVGDLVYYNDGKMLGIVIYVTDPNDDWDIQGVEVHWANGVRMNHSASWLRLATTS